MLRTAQKFFHKDWTKFESALKMAMNLNVDFLKPINMNEDFEKSVNLNVDFEKSVNFTVLIKHSMNVDFFKLKLTLQNQRF